MKSQVVTTAIIAVLLFQCSTIPSYAWTAEHESAALRLLSLSAHPDDEDGATLVYYGKMRGVQTFSIFYTRGEGGQNEIGSELGEELGILRTKETLEAADTLETTARFLEFLDFGYSKTAKETFAKWGGEDSVLARVVYWIRHFKPDVIITNHDTITTSPKRQHGNHQAVGITAFEAFDKAADSTYHPDQLGNGVGPWQVKKLFFRSFVANNIKGESLVKTDVHQRDQTGRTIEQITLAALARHRTQGMDKIHAEADRYYVLVRSDKPYPYDSLDLFSGITPLVRPPVLRERDSVPALRKTSDLSRPATTVKAEISRTAVIGLVKTYDRSLEELFKRYHVPFEFLDSAELAAGDLHRFSTIVLDLRAYAFRPDAQAHSNRLLEYAQEGGNLLCFYHKPGDWNGKHFSPYPIVISNERVTEEDAEVTMLHPEHVFFNHPNKIVPRDWSEWVQERSIYLPSDDTLQTSPKYVRLLAMSDENERQPSTSVLWTAYGKGTYTYVSLALYRQLRVFHEGATKLLFNLLSQPRH